MLYLTKYFGVTVNDLERDLNVEKACIAEITEKVLLMQAKAASEQRRPLGRGTHAKGTSARAQFQVFDVATGRDVGDGEAAGEGDVRQARHLSGDCAIRKCGFESEFRFQARRAIALVFGGPHLRRNRDV